MPSLDGGGAERCLLNLAEEFVRRGQPVDLVLVKAQGALVSQVPDGARLIDLGARRTLLSLPSLLRYLREAHPRALISTLHHANAVALLVRLLLGRQQLPLVVRQENTCSVEYQLGGCKDRLTQRLEKPLLRFADAVVAVSEDAAEDLKRIAPEIAHLVHAIANPVVTPSLAEKAQASVEHPWFRDSEPPVILTVGRLSPQKDHAALLCAFAELAKHREVRLVILGKGPEQAELLALAQRLEIAEHVDFPGFIDNPYAYMAKCSVFALSSRWEGLPTVLIEAMACGAQIVSTDCPSGPREILEDGKWGQLAPVGDIDSLAQALLAALEQPVSKAALTARAGRYSAAASADRHLELINGLRPPPPPRKNREDAA